jgi:hypothetical protein
MTFAARFLGFGGSTVAPSFTITNGSATAVGAGKTPSTYTYQGWSNFALATAGVAATLYPATTFGSVVGGSAGDWKGSTILGVVSRDDGVTTSLAAVYYIYLLGSDSTLTVTSLSIGGTSLAFSSQSITVDSTNGVVRVALTPTTTTTTLFGTTAGTNKAILIT